MRSRIRLIEPTYSHLSVLQQCDIPSILRRSLYYPAKKGRPENLAMILVIDKYLLNHPTERMVTMIYLLS